LKSVQTQQPCGLQADQTPLLTHTTSRRAEDRIRLSGWSKARRVVVLRRRIKQDIAATARQDDGQLVLALAHDGVEDNAQLWEYTVLVTNAEYDISAIGQLYRDRCDCENGFDELKNQWGWGGFTTKDMHLDP